MREYIEYLKSFENDLINYMIVRLETDRVSLDEIEVVANQIGLTDLVPFRVFDKERRIEDLLS